jgi:hypothetical protein
VLVIAAAVLLGSLLQDGPAPHAGTVPSATPSGPARPGSARVTVEVRPGPLIGQPVTVAVRRLRQQGLSVRIVWRPSGEQSPGTVLSVSPAGQRPAGSTVTLTAALAPHAHGHGHGQGHGDNQQGQPGGD